MFDIGFDLIDDGFVLLLPQHFFNILDVYFKCFYLLVSYFLLNGSKVTSIMRYFILPSRL